MDIHHNVLVPVSRVFDVIEKTGRSTLRLVGKVTKVRAIAGASRGALLSANSEYTCPYSGRHSLESGLEFGVVVAMRDDWTDV